MSEDIAIRLNSVGKMYKLYPSRLASFLDAMGIARWFPGQVGSEFWALRGIDLELMRAQRIGIIGRNGAGKSTLLKLITGNYSPTEGSMEVNGRVQALFDAGAGFHPDFTGYENITASLTLQGLSTKEIRQTIEEIADFTELGPFLGQPFKTYSLGMQARLGFATATAIKPDILIVDEVLGAGDAYFASKSNERMKQLVESGASVLIVSHALNEIIRYCDQAIWIERGRIVKRGPSMEIVTLYEGFVHTLDDRRLKAKNRKRLSGKTNSFQLDLYSDSLLITFGFRGLQGEKCDIAGIQLLKQGQIEDELHIGDVQDTNTSFSACLLMDGSSWSAPRRSETGFYRSLMMGEDLSATSLGGAVFYSYGFFAEAGYSIRFRYRCGASSGMTLTVTKNGVPLYDQAPIPTGSGDWQEVELPLEWDSSEQIQEMERESIGVDEPSQEIRGVPVRGDKPGGAGSQPDGPVSRPIVRWPGEGSLTIEKIALLGMNGSEQCVFPVGSPMILTMAVLAHTTGNFHFISAASLYRLDGIFISNFVGHAIPLEFTEGQVREFQLIIPAINLGDGSYVFSLSIFEGIIADESRYDLIDRAYEFKVVGNPPLVANTVFQHSGDWRQL